MISVVIPTVHRRELLQRAVEGALRQCVPFAAEIIVVDNSSEGQQKWIVDATAEFRSVAVSPTLRYVHEPRRGLTNARNRGVSEAKGELIVFLDDDERPLASDWLANLIDAATRSGADAIFGSVIPEYDIAPPRFSIFITELYSRDVPRPGLADITDLVSMLGTGNSCFRRQSCFGDRQAPFSVEFNSTGGEDVDLLFRLRRAGKRFAWAANAAVYEYVPLEKLDKSNLAERRFRQGQQRAYLQISSHPRRYDALLFWMAVGTIQVTYHYVAGRLAELFGREEQSEQHKIQIWGGLGKILWQAKHRRNHYSPQDRGGGPPRKLRLRAHRTTTMAASPYAIVRSDHSRLQFDDTRSIRRLGRPQGEFICCEQLWRLMLPNQFRFDPVKTKSPHASAQFRVIE